MAKKKKATKKKAKGKAKKDTRLTQLVNAAEELNEKLGLEPPIKTDGLSEAELEEKLLEASELLTEEDELTKGTEIIMDSLEAPEEEFEEDFEEEEEAEDEEVEEPEDEDEDDEEEEPEEEDEDEDEEELDEAEEAEEVDVEELEALLKEVKGLKKRAELLELAESEPIFEELLDGVNKLRSAKALGNAMANLLQATIDYKEAEEEEVEKPAKKAKSKSKKKAPKKEAKSKKEPAKKEKKTSKKASKKSGDKPKKKKGQSNKGQIYLAWKDGEEDYEVLHEMVDKAVKLSTIRSWCNGWKNGRGLPAVAED